MEPVKPCNSYAARPSGTATFHNGRSVFKVYYVDIHGRSNPERFEWDLCGRTRESVIEGLRQSNVEGVGVVVSFPHITKVFRFSPAAETIMHVRAYWTPDFTEVDLSREDGYIEFACYAEAIIAGAEYAFWAQAGSVEEYLERWAKWADAPVADCGKLGRWFAK